MLLALTLFSLAAPPDTLVRVPSPYAVDVTADRLEQAAAARGLTRFARIDHAANAAEAELVLRPTVVLIVGNPAAGTLLMHCDQTVAVELPLRILVWADEQDRVWVGHLPVEGLATRYALDPCGQVLARVGQGLTALIAEVVRSP